MPESVADVPSLIGRHVRERLEWDEDRFRVRPMLEWDEPRLPLWVVLPLVPSATHSPVFAVLPDGSLVGNDAPKAFERIVGAVYGDITPADATHLAHLAVYFGVVQRAAHHAVGDLADRIPQTIATDDLPRDSGDVTYRREGDTHVVSFYTCDYELMVLYDCEVRIEGRHVAATIRPVAKGRAP